MTDPSPISDEDLLREFQVGKHQAFAELMRRHAHLVYAVAHRIVRDHGEAEDMVQHVFLEIYRYRADFDPNRGTVKTWLLQYAYTRSIERMKYLSRRKFYHSLDVDEVANRLTGRKCPKCEGGGFTQRVPATRNSPKPIRRALLARNRRAERRIV